MVTRKEGGGGVGVGNGFLILEKMSKGEGGKGIVYVVDKSHLLLPSDTKRFTASEFGLSTPLQSIMPEKNHADIVFIDGVVSFLGVSFLGVVM